MCKRLSIMYHLAGFQCETGLFPLAIFCSDGLVLHHHFLRNLGQLSVTAKAASSPHATDPLCSVGIPEHPKINKQKILVSPIKKINNSEYLWLIQLWYNPSSNNCRRQR